jgi:1-deoxy-D-xylulose-5-phosphate reductoisomerase
VEQQNITVLGSTGSIGLNTLDICRQHPARFNVIALAANRDVEGLLSQCMEFSPEYVVMADDASAAELAARLKQTCSENCPEVLAGIDALDQVAALEKNDMVMAAIVGAAGLKPALATVKAGKKLLLANKEALVLSGHLFIETARQNNAQILPIDSEHNAIYQCLPADFSGDLTAMGVTRLMLTASGGPFLHTSAEALLKVTPAQAVAHPNWDMGKKISVDSATMMNKGLEVVEARWLFDVSPDDIHVVVHPQSVIHSMVEYTDGSVLAQMGNPDMRTPIAHAMAWPERIESGVEKLNLFEVARLDFVEPDYQRFPCLRLAFEALKEKDSAPAILNAANEVTVQAFLDDKIGFMDIAAINEKVLAAIESEDSDSIEHLLEVDSKARIMAGNFITGWKH